MVESRTYIIMYMHQQLITLYKINYVPCVCNYILSVLYCTHSPIVHIHPLYTFTHCTHSPMHKQLILIALTIAQILLISIRKIMYKPLYTPRSPERSQSSGNLKLILYFSVLRYATWFSTFENFTIYNVDSGLLASCSIVRIGPLCTYVRIYIHS